MLKIIAGALPPDAGELRLDGKPLTFSSIENAARAGIAIVSQELSLFPALTVEENLLLAPGARSVSGAPRVRDAGRARYWIVLASMCPSVRPLYRLSLADRQLIEIARALLQNPRVLILDEPTSSLHVAEVERLHDIIRSLRNSGIGIVYVSHFLEELLEISDNLVILRNGRRVTEEIAPSVGAAESGGHGDARRVAGIACRARATRRRSRRQPMPASRRSRSVRCAFPVCAVPAICASTSLKSPPGELVGVAGLAGAGVEELFAVLFGTAKAKAGSIVLPTGARAPGSTARAVKAGIAYTPADRKQFGLMLRQSVAENVVSVRTLTLGRDGFVLRAERLRRAAVERCRQLGVVAGSMHQPVGALSGGNQQKVVFAKWIEAAPSLLVLDDPTRGIDVGAKREMHRIMRQLARSGRVVLFYSSDPGEIAAVADRVVVFVDGVMTKELDGATLTEHELVTAINTGVKPAVKPAA